MKQKILILFTIVLFLCGCNSKEKVNYEFSGDEQIEKIIQEGNYVMVDVRTKEEYEESHIIGAINISYDEINENIELDKNKNIFVYCKSGNRSKIAYNTLKSLGYIVYDLGAFSEIDLPKE